MSVAKFVGDLGRAMKQANAIVQTARGQGPIDVKFDKKLFTADIKSLNTAMQRYHDEVGMSQGEAVRRGVIELLRSLRARTARSKRKAPTSDVTRYSGDGPHYITPKGCGKKSQHRFSVKRRGGSEARVYTIPADSKADARNRCGQYVRWGLARKSWGHAMAALFNRANPEGGNPKAVLKSGLVEGSMREILTGPSPRVEVEVVNKLGYITDATPESVVSAAITAATNNINARVDRRLDEAGKKFSRTN